MVLTELQTLLHDLYELDVAYDVSDFLLTDETVARQLDRDGRQIDEKLLIAEGGGEAAVSLYLEETLVQRLHRHNPTRQLDAGNLGDFWTAIEGVSHFTCYAWNAGWERSVTLLEMELQAEIDRYVATIMLFARQGIRAPGDLHRRLFARPSFDQALSGEELDRYASANRLAALYCRVLQPRLAAGGRDDGLRGELCRFYRLGRNAKIDHIEAQACAARI